MKYIIAAFDQQKQIVDELQTDDKKESEIMFTTMDIKYSRYPVGLYHLENINKYKCYAQSPKFMNKKYTVPLTIIKTNNSSKITLWVCS